MRGFELSAVESTSPPAELSNRLQDGNGRAYFVLFCWQERIVGGRSAASSLN
jgi:hypothetical protein